MGKTNALRFGHQAEQRAVAVETPRSALLDDFEMRLVVAIEHPVGQLAGSGPVDQRQRRHPNHWTLTTVTSASGTMPRMAALGWSCSSIIIGAVLSFRRMPESRRINQLDPDLHRVANKSVVPRVKRLVGARDGDRTRIARGREILSLLCLPISPPGRLADYSERQTQKRESDGRFPFFLLFLWSGRRVSNSRPIPWQGIALPTELLPQIPGGASRSRTDLHGFAIRCITALLSRPA